MANPLQLRAEVLANRPEGAYHRLVLHAPGVPDRVRPGHFATLAVGGEGSALVLRRAFWIHRADPAAGTVELVVAPRGAGSRELAAARAGDLLDLIAPLGTPFPLPDGQVSALLVADGYSSAPLLALAERIQQRGGQVGFILGAATADRLYGVAQARALTQDVLVLTEDGSLGLTGRVTESSRRRSARSTPAWSTPAGRWRCSARSPTTAAELGVRSYVAVEASMACGVGVCMTCVLPVVGEDGRSRFVRVLHRRARLRRRPGPLRRRRHIPADLVGAAAMGVHE